MAQSPVTSDASIVAGASGDIAPAATSQLPLLPEAPGLAALSSEADMYARATLVASSSSTDDSTPPPPSPDEDDVEEQQENTHATIESAARGNYRKHPREEEEEVEEGKEEKCDPPTSSMHDNAPVPVKQEPVAEVPVAATNLQVPSATVKAEPTSPVPQPILVPHAPPTLTMGDDEDDDDDEDTISPQAASHSALMSTTAEVSPTSSITPPMMMTGTQPNHFHAHMMSHGMMPHGYHAAAATGGGSRIRTDSPSPTNMHDPDDNKNGGGSCHQCKTARSRPQLLVCTRMGDRSRKRRCRKKFCHACLLRSYGLNASTMDAEDIESWLCPACNNTCICAACGRRQQGKTGGVGSNPATPTSKMTPKQHPMMHTPALGVPMGMTGAGGMFGMGGSMILPAQSWPLMPLQGGAMTPRSVSAHVTGVKSSMPSHQQHQPHHLHHMHQQQLPHHHHQQHHQSFTPPFSMPMGMNVGLMGLAPSSMPLPFTSSHTSANGSFHSSDASTPYGPMAIPMNVPQPLGSPLPVQPGFGARGVDRLASAPAAISHAFGPPPPHLQPHTLAQASLYVQSPTQQHHSINAHPTKSQKLTHGSDATSNDVYGSGTAAPTVAAPTQAAKQQDATSTPPTPTASTRPTIVPTPVATGTAPAVATDEDRAESAAAHDGAVNDAADALAFLAAAAATTPAVAAAPPAVAAPAPVEPPTAHAITNPPPPMGSTNTLTPIASTNSPKMMPYGGHHPYMYEPVHLPSQPSYQPYGHLSQMSPVGSQHGMYYPQAQPQPPQPYSQHWSHPSLMHHQPMVMPQSMSTPTALSPLNTHPVTGAVMPPTPVGASNSVVMPTARRFMHSFNPMQPAPL